MQRFDLSVYVSIFNYLHADALFKRIMMKLCTVYELLHHFHRLLAIFSKINNLISNILQNRNNNLSNC